MPWSCCCFGGYLGRLAGWRSSPVLDQHWPFPDGKAALTVTIARPLSAADFASIGSVVAEIEKLVAGLTGGDTDA